MRSIPSAAKTYSAVSPSECISRYVFRRASEKSAAGCKEVSSTDPMSRPLPLRIRIRPHSPLPAQPFLLPLPATASSHSTTTVADVAQNIASQLASRAQTQDSNSEEKRTPALALYLDGYRLFDWDYRVEDVFRESDVLDVHSVDHLPSPGSSHRSASVVERRSIKRKRRRYISSSSSSSSATASSPDLSYEESSEAEQSRDLRREPPLKKTRRLQQKDKTTVLKRESIDTRNNQQSREGDIAAEAARIALLIKTEIGRKSDTQSSDESDEGGPVQASKDFSSEDHFPRPTTNSETGTKSFAHSMQTQGSLSGGRTSLPLPRPPSYESRGGAAAALAAYEKASEARKGAPKSLSVQKAPSSSLSSSGSSSSMSNSSSSETENASSTTSDYKSDSSTSSQGTSSSSASRTKSSDSSLTSSARASMKVAVKKRTVSVKEMLDQDRQKTPPGGWVPPGQGLGRTKRNNIRRRLRKKQMRFSHADRNCVTASSDHSPSFEPASSTSLESEDEISSPNVEGAEDEASSPVLGWALDLEPTAPIIPYSGPPPPYQTTPNNAALEEGDQRRRKILQQAPEESFRARLTAREEELAKLKERLRRAEEAKKAAALLPPGGGMFDFDFQLPSKQTDRSCPAVVTEDAEVPTTNQSALPTPARHKPQDSGVHTTISGITNLQVIPVPQSTLTPHNESPPIGRVSTNDRARRRVIEPPNPSQQAAELIPANMVLSSIDCEAWHHAFFDGGDISTRRYEYDRTPLHHRRAAARLISQVRSRKGARPYEISHGSAHERAGHAEGDSIEQDENDEDEDAAARAYRLMQASVKAALRREKEQEALFQQTEAAERDADADNSGFSSQQPPPSENVSDCVTRLPVEFGTRKSQAKQVGILERARAPPQLLGRKQQEVASSPLASVPGRPALVATWSSFQDPAVLTRSPASAAPFLSQPLARGTAAPPVDALPQSTRTLNQRQQQQQSVKRSQLKKKKAWRDLDRPNDDVVSPQQLQPDPFLSKTLDQAAGGTVLPSLLGPGTSAMQAPSKTVDKFLPTHGLPKTANFAMDLDYGEPEGTAVTSRVKRRALQDVPNRCHAGAAASDGRAMSKVSAAMDIAKNAPVSTTPASASGESPSGHIIIAEAANASSSETALDPLAQARAKALQSLLGRRKVESR